MIVAPFCERPLRPTRGLVKLITFVLWLVCDIDFHSSLFVFVLFQAAALKQQQRLFVHPFQPGASSQRRHHDASWFVDMDVRNMDVRAAMHRQEHGCH